MFFSRYRQLMDEISELKKENTALKQQVKEKKRLSKQWENFLSYDGTPQEDRLDEN